MRTEDLVRELRAEAEETASWPLPDLTVLHRARRRRRRRRLLLGGLAASCAAAAVAAAVVLPRGVVGAPYDAPVGPAASPTAAPTTATVGTRAWRATSCPSGRDGCAFPATLSVGGRTLANPEAGSVPTRHGRARSAELSLTVDRRHGTSWVLVGATGSDQRSQLVVRFGDGAWRPLVPGRLTLVRVPAGTPGPVTVRVHERARPLPHEVLRIGTYRAP